jgi:hypothetical protein
MGTAAPSSTSTAAIAEELVSFCKAGNFTDAINAHYSPDIVSVEDGHRNDATRNEGN